MNQPNKPEEPRRVSQPSQNPHEPQEIPGATPPMEAPPVPQTEYEKHVPHAGDQPVAQTGKYGEGSYEGTREYAEGFEEFAKEHSPEESLSKGRKIDPNDPALKEAEQRGKRAGRTSSPSIH